MWWLALTVLFVRTKLNRQVPLTVLFVRTKICRQVPLTVFIRANKIKSSSAQRILRTSFQNSLSLVISCRKSKIIRTHTWICTILFLTQKHYSKADRLKQPILEGVALLYSWDVSRASEKLLVLKLFQSKYLKDLSRADENILVL